MTSNLSGLRRANKGSPCVCGACHINSAACRDEGTSNFRTWCKCLPIRACAFLDTGDYVIESDYMLHACDVENGYAGYAGNLSTTVGTIAVVFMFEDDEDGLWCYLLSNDLGYTGEDRLRVPVGGEYHDSDIRIATCLSLGLEFAIEIPYLGPATLTLEAPDLINVPACLTSGKGDSGCRYDRACVHFIDDNNDVFVLACIEQDAYGNYRYVANFTGLVGFGDKEILIHVDSENPLTLSLGTDVPVTDDPADLSREASCPNMCATWSGDYTGRTIRICGDQRAQCTDCKCRQRCLCVRKIDAESGDVLQGVLCWDDYEEAWIGEVADPNELLASEDLSLFIYCDECTGISYLGITDTDVLVPVDCPDILTDFTVTDDADQPLYYLSIEPANCGGECPELRTLGECCDEPIPPTLTATFIPNTTFGPCGCGSVEVTLTWTEFSPHALPPVYYEEGTGPSARYFAYISEEFQLCGVAHDFTLYAAPCGVVTPPCDVGEVPWNIELWPGFTVPPDQEEAAAQACTECGVVDIYLSQLTLCPPGSAGGGTFDVEILE